jgi:hypothetical protein
MQDVVVLYGRVRYKGQDAWDERFFGKRTFNPSMTRLA